MQKVIKIFAIFSVAVMLSSAALATNGDNLISIGPISRAMGGVGVAAPQDAISAVFANPAAMCFGPYCPSSEVNFAGTLFMPEVTAKISGPAVGGGSLKADSDDPVYAIPAMGVSVPIAPLGPQWRFGVAAFGVSGLGVDYRDSNIDNTNFPWFGPANPGAPLAAGEFSQLQIMRFSPSIAFQPNPAFSIGAGLHIDYSSLDLRQGGKFSFGLGGQLGMIYKPLDSVSLGLTYVTPREVKHEKVNDFDGDGDLDTLELASPQEVDFGVAYNYKSLLLEADIKWLNWSDAKGYEDFDWDDQWVFAVGIQYEVIPKLFLRTGYNYAKNPVDDHDNFDGSFNPLTGAPNDSVNVQGKNVPRYYYETFRAIGFPAVVEHHVSFGAGYEFTPNFALNLGYVHGFKNEVKATGTGLNGQPVKIESELYENSIDFGITWRF